MATIIGPFSVNIATSAQLALATTAWSYCNFDSGITIANGYITLDFVLPPINSATGKRAWGYTYSSDRRIEVNPNRSNNEIMYSIIHEYGHMVDWDRMRNTLRRADIEPYFSPDYPAYTGWKDGPYQYRFSEAFAHAFSKHLYVDGPVPWSGVLNTYYKRTINTSDDAAVRMIIGGSTSLADDAGDGGGGDDPSPTIELTILCTKDASAIAPNEYTPVDTLGGAGAQTASDSAIQDGWNGSENHHPVGRLRGTGWEYKARSFLYFPISFGASQSISGATLWVKQYPRGHVGHAYGSAGGTADIYVRRIKKPFGEAPNVGEATWRQSSNNQWRFKWNAQRYSAKDNSETWVREDEALNTITQSDDHWNAIDVTDIVTAWFDNSKGNRNDAPNEGVIMIAADEDTDTAGMTFYARESNAADTPYLVIVANANNAPDAPPDPDSIPLAPSGDTVVSTLTPNFSGSSSDQDPGDYMTGIEIIVLNDGETRTVWDSGTIALTGNPTTFNIQYGIQSGNTAPETLVGNTFYKWKARTKDRAGAWGPYSTLQRFKTNIPPNGPTVTLVETPLNDVKTATPTVVVTHNDPDPGDTKQYGHHIMVETVGGQLVFDSQPVDLGSGARATTTQTTLPAFTYPWGTQYRVKARTKDSNAAWGTWSAWVQFTTHKTSIPTGLSPSGNTTSPDASPILTGTRSSSSDTIASYEIAMFDDTLAPLWNSGVKTTGISSGSSFGYEYDGPALASGSFYRWEARITSTIGGTSDWSVVARFKVQSDPDVPTPTSPVGGDIFGTGTDAARPGFVGQRTTTFNQYKIEVYNGTAVEGNLGTPVMATGAQTATITGSGPYVFTFAPDVISPLTWGATYKWRAAVSSNAGLTYSSWSGLVAFTMGNASTPTISSPTSDQWLTDSTPDITVARGGSDFLDNMQIRVFGANGTTIMVGPTSDNDYTTNLIAVAGTTTTSATWTYSGPVLSGGYYFVSVRIQRYNNGPWSPWTPQRRFRLNSVPSAPTELRPQPAEIIADDVTPTFTARFNDNDITTNGDYPTLWEIEIRSQDDNTLVTTEAISADLVVGVNTYDYDGVPALTVAERNYIWRTRFTDSLGGAGVWSGYRSFILSTRPNATDLIPTEGSVINDSTPELGWTYDSMGGSAQASVNITVYRVDDPNDTGTFDVDNPPARLAGTDTETLVLVYGPRNKQTDQNHYNFQEPNFYDGEVYQIEVQVVNIDGLEDPTPLVNRVWALLDAPNPIVGLAPTVIPELSLIRLDWTAAPDPPTGPQNIPQEFKRYNIYKKLQGDDLWQFLDSVDDINTPYYLDWYAGNDVQYVYRITVVTTKTGGSTGLELESPDDPGGGNMAESELDSDIWMFVGKDRSVQHIYELPVTDASHSRIIQQEAFETLGSDRKVIIRGFVLGNEGSITVIWENKMVPSVEDFQVDVNETVVGRRLIDYLVAQPGPHILKSPFGDVWDVEYEGPQYQWMAGGHLQVDLNWTETGETSKVSI